MRLSIVEGGCIAPPPASFDLLPTYVGRYTHIGAPTPESLLVWHTTHYVIVHRYQFEPSFPYFQAYNMYLKFFFQRRHCLLDCTASPIALLAVQLTN